MTDTEDTKQQKTEELTDEALDDAQGGNWLQQAQRNRQVHQQEVPRIRECGDQEHLAERLCRLGPPPEAAAGSKGARAMAGRPDIITFTAAACGMLGSRMA